jgi:hypothetical protein
MYKICERTGEIMSIAEANQRILEIKLDSKRSFIEKLKALTPLLIMTGFLTDEPHGLAEINAASWDHFKYINFYLDMNVN